MNILFICKHNRFRSKVAEGYFKKINKNKNIQVKSAGPVRGSAFNNRVKNVAKKLGFSVSGDPRGLTTDDLRWADKIIIVADNVPLSLFSERYRKKLQAWKIPDTEEGNLKQIKIIIGHIMKRVDKLVLELG